MNRVLFVDHSPIFGGAERSLVVLVGAMTRYEPIVAAPAESGLARALPVRPVDLGRLRGGNPIVVSRLARGVGELVRIIRTERIAIVHGNVMRAAPYAAVAARIGRVPFVWHVRDLHRQRAFPRIVGGLASRVIAITHAVAAALPPAIQAKTTVVYDGIDLGRFDPAAERSVRAELGVPVDAPFVVTIGYGAPWKRHDRFVELAERVASRRPDAHFAIVGDCADPRHAVYWQGVQAAAGRLGSRMHLTGAREDIPAILAASDLLVHLAVDEPLGLVLLEAMAMARPVVATAGGGAAEIVADGETGRLIRDPIVDGVPAVLDLIGDPDRARLMGAAGRQRVERRFSADRSAAGVEAVYDNVLSQEPGR